MINVIIGCEVLVHKYVSYHLQKLTFTHSNLLIKTTWIVAVLMVIYLFYQLQYEIIQFIIIYLRKKFLINVKYIEI